MIPAHPLALTAKRRLDERRQRALTRYYLAAGAGGIAVGVHTTQFAIRNTGLLRPVLELAAEVVRATPGPGPGVRPPDSGSVVLVAGVCGPTRQAVREAELAAELGCDAGLVSLGGRVFRSAPDAKLIQHARAVAAVIPLFGFYLQPAIGGRVLSYDFWRRFVEIDEVVAIKIAPFNRYQTLDVIRAVAESGRAAEIALYTGNDDHIILDLVTSFGFHRETRNEKRETSTAYPVSRIPYPGLRMAGGLLGQWAVWTHRAVEHLATCQRVVREGLAVPQRLLTLAAQLTDANAAIFDAAHGFAGCVPGIHEILRRQGLLQGRWCLDPREELSPGQMAQIDRVCAAYPHLADGEFVAAHRDEWLR